MAAQEEISTLRRALNTRDADLQAANQELEKLRGAINNDKTELLRVKDLLAQLQTMAESMTAVQEKIGRAHV